ncbi:MAG: 3-deoxy-manno-octulosonate cytidylyltransferase [Planctomycetes bacterium]|nr:3-deoxy-manno-octulosonate cytidylyltransferase [Planctomycetota bacterium]MCB9869323.1 3-deoxy-manno-octulosonate cytidylyltransferase [Planctomycetota bacterium]
MTQPRETGAIAIIPVRVDSQRLPGKALLAESGKPLFLHTCAQARAAGCFAAVLVATDSDAVARAAEADGYTPVMTGAACRTGSERCAEAARGRAAGVVVDIQGDWPEVDPADLCQLVEALAGDDGDATCATLAVPLADPAAAADPNVVKVVRGCHGDALYFSRLPVPFHRRAEDRTPLLRHIGVYAFTSRTLQRLPELPSSGLDEIEGLEQLRFLENGIRMPVLRASGDPWGIECRADYDAFLARLADQPSRST